MDSPVDRVDNASRNTPTPDEVKSLSPSAPEKERFARALKEKLEEDLRKRRKRPKKDEAIIDHTDPDDEEAEDQEKKADSSNDKQSEEVAGDNDDRKAPLTPGRVDLTG